LEFDLFKIESELQKRTAYQYKWSRKQNDIWDSHTNFIYRIKEFDILLDQIKKHYNELDHDIFTRQEFYNYAANRWINFWSAIAVETIFCSQKNIYPQSDKKDRLIDFTINGITFDHKTSVFPRGFGKPFLYALAHKTELIKWFYHNQSEQQRKHLENRIFLVVYDGINKKHWKLKAEIKWLEKVIINYLSSFKEENLVKLYLKEKPTFSDIIWAIKK